MKCPQCTEECWRDEVDIGVGTQCGPWQCSECGWYEGHETDARIDAERDAMSTDNPTPETMTVTATCGHSVTFRIHPTKPMANRIGKHQNRKCGPCRIADDQARRATGWIGPGKVKKGSEVKQLPPGCWIVLKLEDDGTWLGELRAEGVTVTARGAGLMGMTAKLAKAWLKERGVSVKS